MVNQNLQISSDGQFTRILFATPVNVDLNKISDDIVRNMLKDKIPEHIPEDMELSHGYFCSCVGVQYLQNLGQTPNGENIVNGTTFYLTDVNGNSYGEETLLTHMGKQEGGERPLEIGGILIRARISIDDHALEPDQWDGPNYSGTFDIVGETLLQGIPVSDVKMIDRETVGLSYHRDSRNKLGYRALIFNPTQERVTEAVNPFTELSRYFKGVSLQLFFAAQDVHDAFAYDGQTSQFKGANSTFRTRTPNNLFARADAALAQLAPPLENLETYLIRPVNLN